MAPPAPHSNLSSHSLDPSSSSSSSSSHPTYPASISTIVTTSTTSNPTATSDLVNSLPAPILRLLILFAYPIAILRSTLQVLCWQPGRRAESWMVLGAWWAVCLGSSHVFRWLLPPLLFAPLIPFPSLWLQKSKKKSSPSTTSLSQPPLPSPPPRSTPDDPATSQTLLRTLSDIHTINSLLPPSPLPTFSNLYARFRQLGFVRLVRGLVVIWTLWILLGQFIMGYRILLALAGTIILLLPSPPLAHLVHLLSKSRAVRRAVALIFLFTFGSPPDQTYRFTTNISLFKWVKSKWAASRKPSQALSLPTKPISMDLDVKPSDPIYFRFEIHENQRWWMGLDWTSALLPQERPSWCDSHLLPVPPPLSFSLPSASSIVLPAPTKDDPNAQVRRIATWRWLDEDWSIVRAGQSTTSGQHSSLSPAVRPSSAADDSSSTRSTSSERERVPGRPTSGSFSSSSASDDGNVTPTVQSNSSTAPTSATTAATVAVNVPARAPSMAEQAFTKGLERLKAARAVPAPLLNAGALGGSPVKAPEFRRGRTASQASEDVEEPVAVLGPPIVETDDATDPDGWVYGDNKWENMGPRGGLGKFTRRRRWQRRAVCAETVQRVLPTDPDALAPIATATDSYGTKRSFQHKQQQRNQESDTTPVQNSAAIFSASTPRAPSAPRQSIIGLVSTSPTKHKRRTSQEFAPAQPMTVEYTATGMTGKVGGREGGMVGGADEGQGLGLGTLVPPVNNAGTGGAGSLARDDVLRQRLKKAMGNLGG